MSALKQHNHGCVHGCPWATSLPQPEGTREGLGSFGKATPNLSSPVLIPRGTHGSGQVSCGWRGRDTLLLFVCGLRLTNGYREHREIVSSRPSDRLLTKNSTPLILNSVSLFCFPSFSLTSIGSSRAAQHLGQGSANWLTSHMQLFGCSLRAAVCQLLI